MPVNHRNKGRTSSLYYRSSSVISDKRDEDLYDENVRVNIANWRARPELVDIDEVSNLPLPGILLYETNNVYIDLTQRVNKTRKNEETFCRGSKPRSS